MLMKNFLLLAAMALAATTVSAKQVLSNPEPWGEGILENGVYNFNGSWQGAGTYLGTEEGWCNASAYDLCVLKYSGHTGGTIALGVVYNCWESTQSWGDVYKTESANINKESGYLTIKLNKTDITDDDMLFYEQIRQIQIQDQGSAATLVVEELSFMTQAEYDAETYDPNAVQLGWVEKIVNGDCEGTETESFFSKEYPSDQILASSIVDGAGKDGSRGIVVVSPAKVSQDWDTQFWIAVPEALEAGAKLKVSFDYKASAAVNVDTQAHGEPGDYHHWQMCGTVNFTTEWKTLEWEGELSDAHYLGDGAKAGFRTIAFNLTKADEVTYYFDNISVCVEEEIAVEEPKYFIVNDDVEAGQKIIGWGNGSTIEVVAENGGHAYALTNPSAANFWEAQVAYDVNGVFEEGTEHFLEYDIKGSVAGGTFRAGFQNTDGYKGCGDFDNATITTEWQHVSTSTLCSGPGATRFLFSYGDYAGTVYLDNIQLYTNVPTALETIVAAPAATVTYNLMGQQTNATSGLMIRNGKLIMVK